MAQRTQITRTDDLDGSEAAETVLFALDGSAYEIDLNEAHAAELRQALAPFVAAARRVGSDAPRTSAPRGRDGMIKIDPKAVRAWAQAEGLDVNARGRLKVAVVERYRAARV